MIKRNELAITHAREKSQEIPDMFSDLPPLDPFEIKKDEVATHLAALMAYRKVSRSALAGKLKWKKSMMTRVLSGKGNPTLKTIFDFSHGLGFDFDLVFRPHGEPRPMQPWQKASYVHSLLPALHEARIRLYPLVAQSAEEVVADLRSGRAKPVYISERFPQSRVSSSMITIDSSARMLPSAVSENWIPITIEQPESSQLAVRVTV